MCKQEQEKTQRDNADWRNSDGSTGSLIHSLDIGAMLSLTYRTLAEILESDQVLRSEIRYLKAGQRKCSQSQSIVLGS